MPLNTITHSDALDYLRSLPDNAVHCIISSPPYYSLRDYGIPGQLGLEATLGEYLDKLTVIFREARRVLREDGTLWLNMGDSYAGSGKGGNPDDSQRKGFVGNSQRENAAMPTNGKNVPAGLKPKDLIGVPWRLAFRLQDDGWWLRQDIIWHKPAPMPESVSDRCTKAHEYVFLMTKAAHYWYDAYAIREPGSENSHGGGRNHSGRYTYQSRRNDGNGQFNHGIPAGETGRNKRSVWTVNTSGFSEAHFATFPPKLIEPMILAGCPPKTCAECGAPWTRVIETEPVEVREWSPANGKSKELAPNFSSTRLRGNLQRYRDTGRNHDNPFPARSSTGWLPGCSHDAPVLPGIVLDPFMGAGTVALVATQHGRRWLGCEINADYIAMAERRLSAVNVDMFTSAGL